MRTASVKVGDACNIIVERSPWSMDQSSEETLHLPNLQRKPGRAFHGVNVLEMKPKFFSWESLTANGAHVVHFTLIQRSNVVDCQMIISKVRHCQYCEYKQTRRGAVVHYDLA